MKLLFAGIGSQVLSTADPVRDGLELLLSFRFREVFVQGYQGQRQ